MFEHQKNGRYAEAEELRVNSEQLRRDLEARRVYEMEQQHAHERAQLARARDDELKNSSNFWEKKMADYSSEGERQVKDMEERHRQDADNTRANL